MPRDLAASLLEACGGNLDKAADMYVGDQGGGQAAGQLASSNIDSKFVFLGSEEPLNEVVENLVDTIATKIGHVLTAGGTVTARGAVKAGGPGAAGAAGAAGVKESRKPVGKEEEFKMTEVNEAIERLQVKTPILK